MVFDLKKKIPLDMGKFDLRRQNRVMKGEIGEIIIKNKIPYAHRTREMNKNEFLNYEFPFGKIPEKYKNFLNEYWRTLDVFRIISKDYKFLTIELYEVKTRNYYPNVRRECYIPDMTSREMAVYKIAQKLGLVVKTAIIWFYDDWRYDMIIKNFNPKDFKIREGSKDFLSRMKKSSSNPNKNFF